MSRKDPSLGEWYVERLLTQKEEYQITVDGNIVTISFKFCPSGKLTLLIDRTLTWAFAEELLEKSTKA